MIIVASVNGQNLDVRQPTIADNTANYITARFRFSSAWDGLRKFVHFLHGENAYIVELDENDELTESAHINLAEGEWTIFVHGSVMDGETLVQRITTTQAVVNVERSGIIHEEPFPDMAATVGEVVLARAESAASRAGNEADRAEAAAERAETSCVLKSGDTMTGNLVVPMVKLGNIPTAEEDAVTKGYADNQHAAILEFLSDIVPEQASSSNQLADKEFVNSSVATNTANYISNNGQPFESVEALEAYTGTLTNNDYAFVVGTDGAGNTIYTRYKWSESSNAWAEEFVLNNSSFTAVQWDAINSGITALLVASISGHIVNDSIHTTTAQKAAWSAKYDKPASGIAESDLAEAVQEKLNAERAVIDDTSIGTDAWSSQKIVDAIVPSFSKTGKMVRFKAFPSLPISVQSSANVLDMGRNVYYVKGNAVTSTAFTYACSNNIRITRTTRSGQSSSSTTVTPGQFPAYQKLTYPAGIYILSVHYTARSIAVPTDNKMTLQTSVSSKTFVEGVPLTMTTSFTLDRFYLQESLPTVGGDILEFDVPLEQVASVSDQATALDSVNVVSVSGGRATVQPREGYNNIANINGGDVTVTGKINPQALADIAMGVWT